MDIFLIIIIAVVLFIGWKIFGSAIDSHHLKKREKIMQSPNSELAKSIISFVNEATGEMILRSYRYPEKHSVEWIVSDNIVTINKNGDNGRKTKIVPISEIPTTILQENTSLGYGCLTMRIKGVVSGQFLGTASVLADNSQEIMHFFMSDIEIAKKVHDYISERNSAQSTTAQPSPPQSVADEISKLKQLVDDGVLTQQEFDHKKNKLLGIDT